MEIDDILAEASCLINSTRNEQYGSIDENWTRIGIIWGALLDIEDIPPHLVGVMLAAMKLSRIASNPRHTDNYIDGTAYIAGAGSLAP